MLSWLTLVVGRAEVKLMAVVSSRVVMEEGERRRRKFGQEGEEKRLLTSTQ